MRKKKIKILHVAQAAGGVDRYIRMLLKYLDENEQIGNMDVPFYIPHDDERARFGLPSSARVFHAIKKHDFKEENEIRSIHNY